MCQAGARGDLRGIPVGQALPGRSVQAAETRAVTRSLSATALYIELKGASREKESGEHGSSSVCL